MKNPLWITKAISPVLLFGLAACGDEPTGPLPADKAPLAVQSASAVVTVSVTDFAFSPTIAQSAQGGTIQWNFQGQSPHNATDASGMGLFASGNRVTGSYSFVFVGAGAYRYRCTLHSGMVGTVKVPMRISPATGTSTTRFTVTWASAAAPTSYVYDIQVKRPGATAFVNWKLKQSARSAAFVPDAGVGTYSFRARLRKPANTTQSGYSAAKSIRVS